MLKKASLPPFPPEKVPCYNLFSFLSFPLIFLLYYAIDLFTCLTGEFSPFHSIVHSWSPVFDDITTGSGRIYTYLCSVSLDDQSNVYHRSIRQTEGPQLVSRLPFKIHDLTSVDGFWRAWFPYPPNRLWWGLLHYTDILIPFDLRWRCWIVRICLIWWSYKVQVSFLRVDIGRRHWL